MDPKKFPVLYVDDERANRVVMRHGLRDRFTLLLAGSGEEALDILAEQHVAVVVTDQRMPGMTGVELLEQVYTRHPDVVRVIVTAYSDLASTIAAINRGKVSHFLKKPWLHEELVAVIDECILSYQRQRLVEDVTERVQRMDRLAMRGLLAYSLVHDIRGPLGFIAPTLYVLREDLASFATRCSAEQQEAVAEMMAMLSDVSMGVERLTALTMGILGQLNGHRRLDRPTRLLEVLDGVVAVIRTPVSRVAIFKLLVEQDAAACLVPAGQLEQVLVNLLINAVNAVEPGAVDKNRIEVRAATNEEELTIEVEDSGRGIAPEHQGRVFVPLFTTDKDRGTGLGLTICKDLVQAMGGTIEFESEVGVGTHFFIRLPRAVLPKES